ncbi:hypothetical protein [Bacillus sp. 3255]|uniref:hypothetical protein n=1 Tax=Bacillus sp. 3255 TaxID=2817904 RepID=UPI00286229A7|nr:hypothetical protein [Bacillus sp. 3255]MDR6879639.1 hypothetical protein [Bacillus sp. 3255]
MIDKAFYLALCEDAQKNIDLYRTEAESHVSKWEQTSKKRYDLTPYFYERKHEAPGRVSKKEEITAYGLDKDGEIWVTKCGYIRDSMGYYSRNEHQLINRLYRKGEIDSIEEVIFEDGLPIRYIQFIVRNGRTLESSWHFEEYYEYEDNRLARIKRDEYWSYGQGAREYQYYLSFNDNGKLSQIKDNKNKIIYLDISKSQVLTLREEIRTGLIDESQKILQTICKQAEKEKICYIGIYLHDEPEAVCDPIFHPALEKIRLEQLKQDINYDIWNTGEHPVNYQESIQNRGVIDKFERLVQYWGMKNIWWKESKKLWYEVALELNREDWSKYSPLTEDFVIFVDEEGLELKDLARSIPQEKLNLLRSNGLINK